MLTQERADVLSAFLSADGMRARTLLSLQPHEALRQINALGNNFTLEELNEYGRKLQVASTQGELDTEALDEVIGGAKVPMAHVAVGPLTSLAAGVFLTWGHQPVVNPIFHN